MLRGASAVPEFAHYFNPLLRSIDLTGGRTTVAGTDYGENFDWRLVKPAWDLWNDN